MSENDKKIRKQWLILWIYSLTVTVSALLLQQLLDPALDQIPSMVRYGMCMGSLLGVCGYGFISYHCIYKKPGTKFLVFFLILTAISLVSTPIFYLIGALRADYIPFYGAFVLVGQGVALWWFIISWKMRKVNKRLQKIQ